MLLKIKRIRWQVLVLLILFFSIILGIIIGSATANIVPSSYASESSHTVTANQLKPARCTMDLVNIIIPSNGDNPTQQNDLILGTTGDDIMRGKKGDDCIVGGGGNDTLRGNNGNDVLIGGDGDDRLIGGNNNDICYGGSGANTFKTCESTP